VQGSLPDPAASKVRGSLSLQRSTIPRDQRYGEHFAERTKRSHSLLPYVQKSDFDSGISHEDTDYGGRSCAGESVRLRQKREFFEIGRGIQTSRYEGPGIESAYSCLFRKSKGLANSTRAGAYRKPSLRPVCPRNLSRCPPTRIRLPALGSWLVSQTTPPPMHCRLNIVVRRPRRVPTIDGSQAQRTFRSCPGRNVHALQPRKAWPPDSISPAERQRTPNLQCLHFLRHAGAAGSTLNDHGQPFPIWLARYLVPVG
jgi:hypothetical protein